MQFHTTKFILFWKKFFSILLPKIYIFRNNNFIALSCTLENSRTWNHSTGKHLQVQRIHVSNRNSRIICPTPHLTKTKDPFSRVKFEMCKQFSIIFFPFKFSNFFFGFFWQWRIRGTKTHFGISKVSFSNISRHISTFASSQIIFLLHFA